jgi:catechol 2,3-dioxygenase-like lactoylglutathione lyase family enzyme
VQHNLLIPRASPFHRYNRHQTMAGVCPMFRSNNCVAIHLEDITAAEKFYTNVMKFELLSRSEKYLEYDTGHFLLYVNQDLDTRPPIPSFTVNDIQAAKQSLLENGCTILREDQNSLYFRDPFGITYDIIQSSQQGSKSK